MKLIPPTLLLLFLGSWVCSAEQEATLAAMPELIRTLKEKRYRCVTVSELLENQL